MTTFNDFQVAVSKQLDKLTQHSVFTVATNKVTLWDLYLNSFPEGTNEIYKTNREYDCNCCKSFIRNIGNLVAFVDGEIQTIWDIEVGGEFGIVAEAMATYVKSRLINGIYLHNEKTVGSLTNYKDDEDGNVTSFDHFFYRLPNHLVNKRNIDTVRGKANTSQKVFQRALNEITIESLETVVELIEQGSLYRGEEHLQTVKAFLSYRKGYDLVDDQHLYTWLHSVDARHEITHFRNTVIGTLVVDISEGIDLETAVKKFESKVAPTNYKRPTALITKGMIDNAEKKVKELGIEESLHRRYARTDDLTINNVLFADRSAKEEMGVFDSLKKATPDVLPDLKKVEEVTIDKFISNILPKVDKMELLVDNKHTGNFMSVVAPETKGSKNIFKWGNNFSWSYNGEVADSMKERVKAAGGDVEGELRFSIQWNESGTDNVDLDAHAINAKGDHIYFSNRGCKITGQLDVDIIHPEGKVAVENITWSQKPKDGQYKFYVNNYSSKACKDGFRAEIEYDGKIYSYDYNRSISGGANVYVAEFTIQNGELKFTKSLPNTETSKEVWGINTQKFQKVDMVMNSPNHWDGEETGNKHWFFILDGCVNPDKTRGFYNEFLSNELTEHRKVFEVLGSKLKASESEDQLSGLGFSSTKRDSVVCKVSGNFNRMLKINF